MEDLSEELVALLRDLVFRASDGACCRGRLVTLHVYVATPFGEKPFLDEAVQAAVAPEGESPPLSPERLRLAVELMRNALAPETPPARRIRARNALAQLIEHPDLSDAEKDDAVAALARLNLPRVSPRTLASLKFLVGVARGADRAVRVVCLDESGLGSVPGFPPEAQCWLRLRRGPILALEIAEHARQAALDPNQALALRSATNDWTLAFEPAGAREGTLGVQVRLTADADLAFRSEGFAVVATPVRGETEWYVAPLGPTGEGALGGMPPGGYRLALALAPPMPTAPDLAPPFEVRTRVQMGEAQASVMFETGDPTLANTRCVWVRPSQPGRAALVVGEESVREVAGAGRWRGRAEGRFTLPQSLTPGGEKAIRTRGRVVRTRGAAVTKQPVQPPPLSCLVLL